jgi:hypothetical protein
MTAEPYVRFIVVGADEVQLPVVALNIHPFAFDVPLPCPV